MENQFTRFEMLIWEESISTLKNKKVAIFGLGGVGGNVCDALARSGISNFVLIDHDVVSISNINRQLIANHDNIGRFKVDVMEEHLKKINPEAKIEQINTFYLPENASQFDFSNYDYVVDAIDTVSAKIDIIERCIIAHTPIISALGCGNKINPTMLEVSDISKTSYDPLAKVLRRELKKRGINHLKVVYSKEQPLPLQFEVDNGDSKKHVPGSSAFVPPAAGIIIASEVVKDLLNLNKKN